MTNNEWDDDPWYEEDDDYDTAGPPHHEQWISLGLGIWLILHTCPDGGAVALWAIEQPGGGMRIGGIV